MVFFCLFSVCVELVFFGCGCLGCVYVVQQSSLFSFAEIEDERNVKVLLETHAELIKGLRETCKDVLAEEHDDIFLLRYILSYKTVSWKKKYFFCCFKF